MMTVTGLDYPLSLLLQPTKILKKVVELLKSYAYTCFAQRDIFENLSIMNRCLAVPLFLSTET